MTKLLVTFFARVKFGIFTKSINSDFEVEEVLSQKLSQLSSQNEFESEIAVGFETVGEIEEIEECQICCGCGSKFNF